MGNAVMRAATLIGALWKRDPRGQAYKHGRTGPARSAGVHRDRRGDGGAGGVITRYILRIRLLIQIMEFSIAQLVW